MEQLISNGVTLLVRVIFYIVAIPMSLLVLVIWGARLVVTIVVMVFAMIIAAYRERSTERYMKIIEHVARIGPESVKRLWMAPFITSQEHGSQGSDLFLELAYLAIFVGTVLAYRFIEPIVSRLGQNIKVPNPVFAPHEIWSLISILYIIINIGALITVGRELDDEHSLIVKPILIPISLMLSGLLLFVFICICLGVNI